MPRISLCSPIAVLSLLTLPIAVQAAPPDRLVPDTVERLANGAVGGELAAAAREVQSQQAADLIAQPVSIDPAAAVASAPVAAPAPAAVSAAPAAGTMLGLTFEQLVALLASVVVPLFLGLCGLIWKDSAKQKEAKIAEWTRAAYLITEEVAKLTPTKIDDKIAYALKVLTERLAAAGISTTPAVADQAKAVWTAMSGAEKVEAGVRAKAVALVAEKVDARPQTPLAG